MNELRFNVPPTVRSHRDAGDRSCNPWIGSLACDPLHCHPSRLETLVKEITQFSFHFQIFIMSDALFLSVEDNVNCQD